MAESVGQDILRRKLDAGRATAPVNRAVLPAKALSSALSKAAEAVMGLAVSASSCSERVASLPDLLERLPENGLLTVLEGPEEGQGILALDGNALSAVIEKQMTGAVAPNPPPPRRATRTDAALVADLVDATLQRFETALAGRSDARWASGFGYSSHVEDLRPLGLLLEEMDYRIFGIALDFEIGTREGQMLLALPAEGRGPVHGNAPEEQAQTTVTDPDWAPGLEKRVLRGEVRLEAILHSLRLPIAAVESLKVGDEIPIPLSALDNVRLAGAESVPLGRCRLGRTKDHRAVRLGSEGGEDGAMVAETGALSSSGIAERDGAMTGLPSLPDVSPTTTEPPGLPELPLPGEAAETLPPLLGNDLPDLGPEPMATPMPIAGLDGLPDIS